MADASSPDARASKLLARRVVVAMVVVALIAGATLLILDARGGGAVPGWLGFLRAGDAGLLDVSSPEEAVCRSLRLAGYDHAVVGADAGTVVVRLDIPLARTAADIELSWQTALGSAVGAFPDADRYVAQVFIGAAPHVEVGIGGSEMREAVDSVRPAATVRTFAEVALLIGGREAQTFTAGEVAAMPVHSELAVAARALTEMEPQGATAMPDGAIAIDIDASGAYLDAKNRAAGLLGHDGPSAAVSSADAMWIEAREVTVLPVAPADQDAAMYYATRLIEALEGQPDVDGAQVLTDDVLLALGRSDTPPDASELKSWWHVAAATGRRDPSGDVVLHARDTVALVLEQPVEQGGPLADAVLAWAGHATTPDDARQVRVFERTPSLDASAVVSQEGLVGRVLSRHAQADSPPVISWQDAGVMHTASPTVYPAATSPAGRLCWSAGLQAQADVALTDGSLRGYAFGIERAWLVDADDLGMILAVYGLE